MSPARQGAQGGRGLRLLMLCAVLLLAGLNWRLLTAEIDTSAIPPAASDAEAQLAAIAALPNAADAAPQSYPQTLSRPLFRATRRPPEREQPAAAARPQAAPPRQAARLPENLELVGIMQEEGRAGRALIRQGEAATGQWVEVGHMLQGWRLSRIEAGGIAFEAEGREQRLTLYREAGR
jgi:hypothetical protein